MIIQNSAIVVSDMLLKCTQHYKKVKNLEDNSKIAEHNLRIEIQTIEYIHTQIKQNKLNILV
jgi:hypothetical protein